MKPTLREQAAEFIGKPYQALMDALNPAGKEIRRRNEADQADKARDERKAQIKKGWDDLERQEQEIRKKRGK